MSLSLVVSLTIKVRLGTDACYHVRQPLAVPRSPTIKDPRTNKAEALGSPLLHVQTGYLPDACLHSSKRCFSALFFSNENGGPVTIVILSISLHPPLLVLFLTTARFIFIKNMVVLNTVL